MGVTLDFDTLPHQTFIPKPLQFSKLETQAIDVEIADFLDKGIIEKTCHSEPEFISNVFTREKRDGSRRVILNLSALNPFIEYHHFKMDTIETVIGLIRSNCYMASLDLSNAYFSVPVATSDRSYLKFKWKKELYEFAVLPNGLSSAPRIFTKVLKPVYAHLRKLGFVASAYIDDSFLMAGSYDTCFDNVRVTKQVLESVGFSINFAKSMLTPRQKMEHLGFVLDSQTMTVAVTKEKQDKLVDKCHVVLEHRSPTIRLVAELIGIIVSSFTGAEYGPLHFRALEFEKSQALKEARGNFDGPICLSVTARNEILWWVENTHSQFRYIDHGKYGGFLTTDSSKEGWGAVFSTLPDDESPNSAGARWTLEEKEQHINILELKAGLMGLKTFCTNVHHVHIKINMDNTTAICYLQHKGGSISQQCNVLAKDIWTFCIDRNIWLTAAHLPGHLNVLADERSRIFDDKTEWKLNASVFQSIVREFGKPAIDLFASRLNFQLKPYISWKPDPEACHVDAFTLDWSNIVFYAFPPFSIISQVIKKIEVDGATGILIVPDWPTQAWYPLLWRLLLAEPLRLNWQHDLVILPFRPGPHPLGKKLQLMACHLCGTRY